MNVMNRLGYGLHFVGKKTAKGIINGAKLVGINVAEGAKEFATGLKGVKLDNKPIVQMATPRKQKA